MEGASSTSARNSAGADSPVMAAAPSPTRLPGSGRVGGARVHRVATVSLVAVAVLLPMVAVLRRAAIAASETLSPEEAALMERTLGDDFQIMEGTDDEPGSISNDTVAAFQESIKRKLERLPEHLREKAVSHYIKLGKDMGGMEQMQAFRMPERHFRGSPGMRCIVDLFDSGHKGDIFRDCAFAVRFALDGPLHAAGSLAAAVAVAAAGAALAGGVGAAKRGGAQAPPASFWSCCETWAEEGDEGAPDSCALRENGGAPAPEGALADAVPQSVM